MERLAQYAGMIEQELGKLDFPMRPENLYDPLRYFLKIGGKRIRPALVLMGAELFGCVSEKAIPAALAVEIFHNFTLIHDDIMDRAPLRRGQQTVHEKWNTSIAILSGDVLFVKAYAQLAQQQAEHLPELLRIFNRTAQEVCEGQQLDMDFEVQSDVQIAAYLEMIRLKTSVLLGCALELGAIIAEAKESDRTKLYTFGQEIGIAFQIQDDILDLYADPDKFGKQVGGDVISGKKTLLHLKAFERAGARDRERLIAVSNERDPKLKVGVTRKIYDELGVKQACTELMEMHYRKAIGALEAVNTDENLKNTLRELAAYLIQRDV